MKSIHGQFSRIFKPQDELEEKILRRIGIWTVRLYEYRAKQKGLIPYERILEERKERFGNPVGERLAQIRKRRGITQEELSKKSGVSQSTISKIESGEKPISPTDAKALAPVLKCTVKYLAIGK